MSSDKVKVRASATADGGATVVTVDGGEPGGHTATVRFQDPDYGPSAYSFDAANGLVVERAAVHGSVIVVVDGGGELRVDVAEYVPAKVEKPKPAAKVEADDESADDEKGE